MNDLTKSSCVRKPVTRQDFSTSESWLDYLFPAALQLPAWTMSYYRSVYLKSDDWKSLRSERLSVANFKCEICGDDSVPLDVHHIKYRKLFNVGRKDLRALCRQCHNAVHRLLKKYNKLKTLGRTKQWQIIISHMKHRLNVFRRRKVSSYNVADTFSRCRDVLVSLKMVKRQRMIWMPCLESAIPRLRNPILFLQDYIAKTGIDPRYRPDRIGAQKLLTFPIQRSGKMKWRAFQWMRPCVAERVKRKRSRDFLKKCLKIE